MPRLRCHASFALLLLASASAHGAVYCVDTTAELQQAFAAAQLGSADDEIRIVQGTYSITSDLVHQPSSNAGALIVRGGYSGDCSAGVRTRDARATTLLAAPGVDLVVGQLSRTETSILSTLELVGFGRTEFRISPCVGTALDAYLTVANLLVSGGGSASQPALLLDNTCGSTNLYNVLVTDAPDDGLVVVASATTDTVDIINLTSVDNGGIGVSIVQLGPTTLRMWNSIAYGNGTDIAVNSGELGVRESIFQTSAGGGQITGSGNLSANPQLDAAYFPIQPTSPAIDSGTASVTGGLVAYDLSGGLRVVGASVDRGALESGNAVGATLTVTNTNIGGAGSLNQAILDAQAAPGNQVIEFQIPGACPRTIPVPVALPALVDAVSIRGDTQPGSTLNDSAVGYTADICVVLLATGSVQQALLVATGSGGPAVEVRGLGFSNFAAAGAAAIRVQSGVGHFITGNQFGGSSGATSLLANRSAISIEGTARNVTIGGVEESAMNLIGGSLGDGVVIRDGSQSNIVRGNLIGTSASGTAPLPNQVGVHLLQAPYNTVTYNTISGNASHGVRIEGNAAEGNTVSFNRIGLKTLAFCLPPCTPNPDLGNTGHGVLIERAATDPVDPGKPANTKLEANVVAYNDGAGFRIRHGRLHRVLRGMIYDNDGLGIDLNDPGHSPNDDDSTAPPDLANIGQNAPEITAATNGRVDGTLSSIPGSYAIQIFGSPACDPTGWGEGRTRVGTAFVSLAGSGQVTSSWTAQGDTLWGDVSGQFVSAIAYRTDVGSPIPIDPGDGVSEFSVCVPATVVDELLSDGFE